MEDVRGVTVLPLLMSSPVCASNLRNWSMAFSSVRRGLLNWIRLGCRLLSGPSTRHERSL